jgi:serine phosphatase RsbU (regulator of sigma subunit)/pSer/pThr/pTyr-binding forkhead associated (FHA) protein
MTAYLVAANGAGRGQRYCVIDQLVLGRQPGCQVLVSGDAVSRRHARVVRRGDDYFVEDLKSHNGTFLDDEMLAPHAPRLLQSRSMIRICDAEFFFELDDEPLVPAVVVDEDSDDESSVESRIDASASDLTASAGTAAARLKAMVEITQSMSKTLALGEVLPKVLKSLFKIFPQADRGFIVLRDLDGNLVPRWTRTRGDREAAVRISRTMVRRVMDAKEAVLATTQPGQSRFELGESSAGLGIRSMMCAPLLGGDGEPLGALQIDTTDGERCFSTEDLEVLAGVAAQASIAIENANFHEQTVARRELERDLQLAREVQAGLLPDEPPNVPNYTFLHYYQPASHVGGDYFDYVELPDGRLAVVVADVVGHGVAAALLMVKVAAELRFSLATHREPSQALTHLNERYSRLRIDRRMVTLVMCVLDAEKHEVTIVSAGHMPPLVRGPRGDLKEVGDDAGGLPLGVLEETEYNQARYTLQPGEVMILYTDGLTEALNLDDKEYTGDRLKTVIAQTADSLPALTDSVLADIRRHMGPRPQCDDMCLVAFGLS